MKKNRAMSILLALLLTVTLLCCPAAAEENEADILPQPGVSAVSAVLYCGNTGEFIFEKNADAKLPMASTTKIMTCLLALEAENKTVKITSDMYAEGSSMYLAEGNKIKLHDLAAGMMMVSGNDAANAVAIAVGGDFEGFAKLMNAKAKKIGMKDTSFVTASGLHDENHYSTAKDMAILMAYAMKNEEFASITKNKSMDIPFVEPEGTVKTYSNHNRLLSSYEYCNGGKTGYTSEAGRCLVSSAYKDGVELYAVTFHAPNDWSDHREMYNYGFSLFKTVTPDDENVEIDVVGSETKKVKAASKSKESIVVRKGEEAKIESVICMPAFVYAPVKEGNEVGKVVYMYNGKALGESKLIVQGDVEYKEVELGFFESIGNFFSGLFS